MNRLWPAFLLLATPLTGAELAISPPTVVLTGAKATQQLHVHDTDGPRVTAERIEGISFASADPKIARVSQDGKVAPAGNGRTIVTATVGGRKVSIPVEIVGFEKPVEWSFTSHVQATLTRTGCNSGACHGALAGKGGFKLSLRGYDDAADHFAMTRQAFARRVDREKPEESLLLKKGARLMPHGGGTRMDTESEHYAVILDWIRSDAPGTSSTDPVAKSLEILPRNARLQPKQTLRYNVRATFSDGSVQDVTRWVKFSSSNEQAATVDEDGLATVAGNGEASISAIYGSLVANATITAPYPNKVDPSVFTNARRSNFIDDHVLAKLQLLNLPPSPDCTDTEFIRRVYLDTCGILPKVDEVEKFLPDPDPKKRAKLIDRLLERSDFVDYWTHKWCDLMLVSTRKLTQQAAWGFNRKIRSSVADNRSWDEFARDILTASGSTLTHGGGNYFVLHKDVTDLVESTAVTFLGMSITCARCHNHPLERWTQDQYWQMANLFSRVGLKNGDRPGEVLVQSLPAGEARHLRKGVPEKPTPLDGTPLPFDSATDRREYFADWLTNPANPYFAKAAVNRIWKNYLGRGLIEAEDDVRETNPPSNAELLDALTKEFIAKKFDTKSLMRAILNSATYQRSSKPLPGNAEDNRFYSRYLLRRLPAEVILDAYSDVTGVHTPFDKLAVGASGGTKAVALYPLGTRAMQVPDSQMVSQFLDVFGRAERTLTCSCEVTKDASVAQALHLNNGQTLNNKLRDPKSIVNAWLKAEAKDSEIVDRIFRTTLSRPPTDAERAKVMKVLAEAGPAARREAIEDALWAVLTGREFLFNR